MRKAAFLSFTLAILPLCAQPATSTAQEKMSREDFLRSKLEEANKMCHDYIISTAKDPDSVKFLGDDRWDIGHGIARNEIQFSIPIMGRNSYGAVLRHLMNCNVNCTEKNGCRVSRLYDTP